MTDLPEAFGHAGADRELATSRRIRAPRERVFAAFSDPGLLATWWGPAGFTNTFETFDLRPGGRWRFVMHGPDGRDYRNESVFVSVEPPRRVVFLHVSGHRFEMTITFEEEGEETVVGWRQLFESAAERNRVAEYAVAANEQNLDRLEAVVRGSAPPAGA
ncbi:MAG: polyketide cyclase [Acidobacteria bacterium]|nr:MAG: polyketide cyclase [Acidobacteriota bacterium]